MSGKISKQQRTQTGVDNVISVLEEFEEKEKRTIIAEVCKIEQINICDDDF